MSLQDIKKARGEKISLLKKDGINPYPPTSDRTHTVAEALGRFEEFAARKTPLTLTGRMLLKREHGGSTLFHFADATGRIQGYAKKDVLGEAAHKTFLALFDVGDIVEVSGTLFRTKKEEKTVEAHSIRILAKSLRPLPEKWHGLTDTEERFRKRYLDLTMNPDARDRFAVRSQVIQALRDYFIGAGFLEVETPILQTVPGGALARPFKTRMETLGLDLYLRIAPELYLKRLLVGGFEQIFEIGRCFRNEGTDRDHNPEFTMLEAYAAYRDYEWLMAFTERMLVHVIGKDLNRAEHTISFGGSDIHVAAPFQRMEFSEVLKEATGLDYWEAGEADFLKKIKEHDITVEKTPTKVVLADELFKKTVRPILRSPAFVINHPAKIKPLAKPHRGDPRKAESFQLYIGGIELVNAYTELNDPTEQRARFEAQAQVRKGGDEESHRMDEDYLEALEYGMPPAAGIGIGIDRLVRLLTDSTTLREVLLFPTMKPR